MNRNAIRNLTFAALYLALALVLPFLTGQIPQIGSMLSPMHIPVLLCGFTCGWPYGLAVGAVAPLLRFVLFGMPPIFPTGTAMAFELAAYGVSAALLYRAFPKKVPFVYLALILSMIAGRLVWGAAMFVIMATQGGAFTFAAFLAGAITKAVPGLILHIAIIPPIVLVLQKAKLVSEK